MHVSHKNAFKVRVTDQIRVIGQGSPSSSPHKSSPSVTRSWSNGIAMRFGARNSLRKVHFDVMK